MDFYATTWNELRCGDYVKAPDATIWLIGASITFGDGGEWEIINRITGESMWTPQRKATAVMAARLEGDLTLAGGTHADTVNG